jgi:serpin B
MRTRAFFALSAISPFLFGTQLETRAAPAPSVVAGNTAFAFDLYSQLKSNQGNLFLSPYSISSCLAMTSAGARGETEKQMVRALHLDTNPDKIHSSFGELQGQLTVANGRGVELSIANSLWAQKGEHFLPAFLDITKSSYRAEVTQVDFLKEPEPARAEINRWVAKQTREKINEILPPGSLTSYTRLVLVNAIYFKGLWGKQFEKRETVSQPFHISPTRDVDVQLMHHVDDVRYMETSEFQAVELPYQGGLLSMVILLPRRVDGCSDLEGRLNPRLLSSSMSQMKRRSVEIFLPRFKLDEGFNLSGALMKLGMSDAFDSKVADLSGMDGTRRLFVSGVFHKAWVEVNEEGTEAAASTAVVVATKSAELSPSPTPVFRADRPFVFFIRETTSGSILFLGRLAEPQQ